MRDELYCLGIPVNVTLAKGSIRVYADIYPSIPYFNFKRNGRSIKYWLKGIINRKWNEPHIRWWVEIYSSLDGGSHHITRDTGSITLRGAMMKAAEAVDQVVEEIEKQND